MEIRPLSAVFAVFDRQLRPEDVADIAAAGYSRIINNRPDEEADPGADGVAIEAACQAAGIEYRAVPFRPGQLTSETVSDFAKASEAEGPVLAYCRSGTRSSTLWALNQAQNRPVEEVLEAARAAGYDLANLRILLASLPQKAD